jgi:glycosyltransferase involved in cell wall biosynthesis
MSVDSPSGSHARSERELPRVTVIVPCFNAAGRIRVLLDAMQQQSYPQELYRLVIVDDGSTDETREIVASYPGVTLLRQKNGGSYKARNTGIRQSSGEIIVFTDDDCRPEPDWLRRGVDAFFDPEVDLVAGRVKIESRDPRSLIELFDANFHLKQELYVRTMRWAVTANLFVRRRVLEALNGFNEALRSGGDRAFGRAATAAGHKLVYVPEAAVNHPTRRKLSGLVKKVSRIANNTAFQGFRQFLPRSMSKFPPGFHLPEVLALRGVRKWQFRALFYLLELVRVVALAGSLVVSAVTGRNRTAFRGLHSAERSDGRELGAPELP